MPQEEIGVLGVVNPGKGHDRCSCGNWKRKKNKRCAKCRGYGKKRTIMANGYVRIFDPTHPLAAKDGQVLEHRKVLYDAGVEIPKGMHVHHINGDVQDNSIENLEVKTVSNHRRGHAQEKGYVGNQYGRWYPRKEEV